jgi:peptidoglycan/LPS O-acetylase OafA/YrhL
MADASVKQPGRKLAALTGLRGIGMLLIVVSHTSFHSGDKLQGALAPVLARMDLGVALFFALSGFFLYRSFARAALDGRPLPSLRAFAAHRTVRILPAYWLAVLMAWAFIPANHDANVADLIRQLTLTRIYQRHDTSFFEGTVQTWSLDTIVAFYLFVPLLAWIAVAGLAGAPPRRVLRRQSMVIAACVAASPVFTAAWAAGWIPWPLGHHWLPAYLGWFGAGMALALASLVLARNEAGPVSRLAGVAASVPGTVYLVALAAFAIAATPIAGPGGLDLGDGFHQVARIGLLGVIACLIVLPPALDPSSTNIATRVLSAPPLLWLGEISYGVFLYHVIALILVADWLEIPPFTGRFWTLTAATLAVTIPAAWMSYRYLESPLIDRVRRLIGQPTTASESAIRTRI